MSQLNWDDRYSSDEFVYGVEPNTFSVEHSELLSGRVLSISEGEGRNAVFLASLGLQVHAVDGSEVGLEKAHRLAKAKGVELQTQVADLEIFEPSAESYHAVISISAHLPTRIRHRLYPLIVKCLKPNGLLILESYAENQIHRSTGGPKDLDMLMTTTKIEREFSGLEPILLQEVEREVCEGKLHTGIASVVQFIGRKPR